MARLRTLATLLTFIMSLPAIAAGSPGAPAEPLAARVLEVAGTVETRPANGRDLRPVEVGTTLAEGADLRTGFRARCILDMVDSLVQIEPLSVVRLAELERTGGRVRTRLHLKQGRAQAVVEKGRIESDFAVVTPSATLSVRGTRGIHCRYFPDTGGTYGLADRGLIAIIDGVTGREAGVRPGQETDDRATLASEHLADRYMPIALDPAGHETHEKRAVRRRRSGLALMAGLKDDPKKLSNRRVQEINRADSTVRDVVNTGSGLLGLGS